MGRLGLAIRMFFRILTDAAVAGDAQTLLTADRQAAQEAPPSAAERPAVPPKPTKPARSEALTLLAALQREARLVDFIQEPLDGYSDAQVGAAVREVHRQCSTLLTRAFDLQQVLPQEEGSEVEVPDGFDAARFRLTGNVVGEPPYRGRLVHHGWEAARCELPTWTGSVGAAWVVVPAEVEVK